ncbi:MAG: hypothetical protein V1866_05045 [archaeon]
MSDMIYRVEEGIEKIIELTKGMRDDGIKPVLISLHAPAPHSGKTYLMGRMTNAFWKKGIKTHGTNDFEDAQFYEREKNYDVLMLHIGTGTTGQWFADYKVKEATKRSIDVHVYIYNPHMNSPELEKIVKYYDVIIINPNSKRK